MTSTSAAPGWVPMDSTTATSVFDVLERECAASVNMREDFAFHQTDRVCEEYRFGGMLGFGGKFRRNVGRRPDGTWGEIWYVDAYPEELPDNALGQSRRLAIAAANAELEKLRQAFAAIASP